MLVNDSKYGSRWRWLRIDYYTVNLYGLFQVSVIVSLNGLKNHIINSAVNIGRNPTDTFWLKVFDFLAVCGEGKLVCLFVKGSPASLNFPLQLFLIITNFLKDNVSQSKACIHGSELAAKRHVKGGEFRFIDKLMLYFSPGILQNGTDLNFTDQALGKRQGTFFWHTVLGNGDKHMNGLIAEFTERLLSTLILDFLNDKIFFNLLLYFTKVFKKCANNPDSHHVGKLDKIIFFGFVRL